MNSNVTQYKYSLIYKLPTHLLAFIASIVVPLILVAAFIITILQKFEVYNFSRIDTPSPPIVVGLLALFLSVFFGVCSNFVISVFPEIEVNSNEFRVTTILGKSSWISKVDIITIRPYPRSILRGIYIVESARLPWIYGLISWSYRTQHPCFLINSRIYNYQKLIEDLTLEPKL